MASTGGNVTNIILFGCCTCGGRTSIEQPETRNPEPELGQTEERSRNWETTETKYPKSESDGYPVRFEGVKDANSSVIDPPSKFYYIFGSIGLVFLILDMGTDAYSAIGSFRLGRYIFGTLIVVPIALPIVIHLTSNYYKEQEFLIKLDGKEGFVGSGILKTGLLDPIIWCFNHLRATKAYMKGAAPERRDDHPLEPINEGSPNSPIGNGEGETMNLLADPIDLNRNGNGEMQNVQASRTESQIELNQSKGDEQVEIEDSNDKETSTTDLQSFIDLETNKKTDAQILRENFYKSKQMFQLAMKNEAQLEATVQSALALFRLIYYYGEEGTTERYIAIASLVFSCVSIGRAACSDLVKTFVKYETGGHYIINGVDLNQSLAWKLPRLASLAMITGATLIANVTFVLYWNYAAKPILTSSIWNEPIISLIFGGLLMILINVISQVGWGLIASSYFFINDFNLGKCCTVQLWRTWVHFVIRAPLINIFRSANLYYYSNLIFKRIVLTGMNAFSLIVLFTPYCIHGGLDSEIHPWIVGIFFLSLLLSFGFQAMASCFIGGTLEFLNSKSGPPEKDEHIIRLYQLP